MIDHQSSKTQEPETTMNTMNANDSDLRVLQDSELDAISGGAECKVNDAKPITRVEVPGKGILAMGTETCNGVDLPYAIWIPSK
jgi:hypothetical protein